MKPLPVLLALIMLPALQAAAQGFEQATVSRDLNTPWSVTSGDFDGDGDVDFIAAEFTGQLIWLEALNNAYTDHGLIYSASFRGITSGDFDGDDDIDIVAADFGNSRFILLENTGSGEEDRFEVAVLVESANHAWSVRAGHGNADNAVDLVTTEYNGNRVRVFLQGAAGLQQVFIAVASYATDARFVDFDGDGDIDVVGCSFDDGVFWLENVGGGDYSQEFFEFGFGGMEVEPVDLDGDGDIDLAVALFEEDCVSIWWRNGEEFQRETLLPHMFNTRTVKSADFDRDGDLDLIAASEYSGFVVWWEREGGQFIEHQLDSGMGPTFLHIVDTDLDGDPDAVAADQEAGEILLYRNEMGIPAVIAGTVREELTGEPVPDVMVTAVEAALTVLSDEAGWYRLRLAAGSYTVAVEKTCWNSDSLIGIEAVIGDTSDADFQLRRPLAEVPFTSLDLPVYNHTATVEELSIFNNGDGILHVEAAALGNFPDDQWLFIEPPEIDVPAGSDFTFQITVEPDTSDLAVWDYLGEIVLRTNACPDSVIHLAVVVTVLEAEPQTGPLPVEFRFGPVYPNPFNASASVQLTLPESADVEVNLYDVQGRWIRSITGGRLERGVHRITVDAGDLSTGTYFITLSGSAGQAASKLVLIK